MSLREFDIIVEVARKRDAHLAWLNSCYAAAAFHRPNDMPDDPMTRKATRREVPPDVQSEINDIRRRVLLQHEMKKATHHGP